MSNILKGAGFRLCPLSPGGYNGSFFGLLTKKEPFSK
jgi:hypothetical protein